VLQVLLIRRGNEPFKGDWAFPGGFMEMDETAETCALRELQEETSLDINMIKQLGAFSDVHRDPRGRVISIAFYALVRPTEVTGGDDASEARWFALDDVPRLAFDHDYILRKATQQLRKDIHFEPIGFELLDKVFTMPELQRLYEAILGVHFDRRNFEKKMLQTGILKQEEEEEEEEDMDALAKKLMNTPVWSSHFGRNHEMKRKNIDELFGGPSTPQSSSPKTIAAPALPPLPHENGCSTSLFNEIFPTICSEEPSAEVPQRKPGRKGRKFSFNKEEYDRFKQDNNFKLEF
jgi:8-oxo-dGTP diphosphatase